MEACRNQLSKHGLAIIQSTQFDGESKWIESVLVHSSGEWVSSRYPVKPAKDDLQGLGSATTYARRYSLMALVGIVAEDEDDDAEAAVGRASGNGQAKAVDPLPPLQRPKQADPKAAAVKWVKEAEATVKGFTRIGDLRAWDDKNQDALKRLHILDIDLFEQIDLVIGESLRRLSPANA